MMIDRRSAGAESGVASGVVSGVSPRAVAEEVAGGTDDRLLLGVELGRSRVRLALLDPGATVLLDAVEQPIVRVAGGPRDPVGEEQAVRLAVVAALTRLGVDEGLRPAATIGFPHCGVGSGPVIGRWLQEFEHDLGEPLLCTNGNGVSYVPARCLDAVQQVFEAVGLNLSAVELSAVAAGRVLGRVSSAAVTLGSGVAWSARILNSEVLEAYEIVDGPLDDPLRIVVNGIGQPVERLAGVVVDADMCRRRGVEPHRLAPAVGVARSLIASWGTNLLEAVPVSLHTAARSPRAGEAAAAVAVPVAIPLRGRSPAGLGPDVETFRRRPHDTYQLRRIPSLPQPYRPSPRPPVPRPVRPGHGAGVGAGALFDPASDDLAGIEAFAHPGDLELARFDLLDFALGALGMLTIVLLALLVLR
ncbi:MAG: hypothetical protein ACFCVK_20870 [Acidimicrobiales bacterium]